MALGSLLLAPLADIYDRRKLIFTSLVLTATGMAASALVLDVTTLAMFRFVTGLGSGT